RGDQQEEEPAPRPAALRPDEEEQRQGDEGQQRDEGRADPSAERRTRPLRRLLGIHEGLPSPRSTREQYAPQPPDQHRDFGHAVGTPAAQEALGALRLALDSSTTYSKS